MNTKNYYLHMCLKKTIFEILEETKKMKSEEWSEQMRDQLPNL